MDSRITGSKIDTSVNVKEGVNTLIAVINEEALFRERTLELWGQDWLPVKSRIPSYKEGHTVKCIHTKQLVVMKPSYEVDMDRLSEEQIERLANYIGYWPSNLYLEAEHWILMDSWPIDGQEIGDG